MKVLGQRLRLLRESVRLSQAKLAEIIEVSQASINRYENDLSSPTPETLVRYADYFDVSLDYIFGRTDRPGGIQYEYVPKAITEQMRNKDEWAQFVDMCFDPDSPMSARLKDTMLRMMDERK